MSDIQKEVTQAMGLSKKIELALDLAGLEIRKVDNRRENIGLHPCLAFAIQLRKVVGMSADQNSKSVVDPEQTFRRGPTAPVLFRYTNHEGKTRVRSAVIKRIFFCATKWHKEPQWIIRAFCTEHQADRDFALRDCDFLSVNKMDGSNDKFIVAHPSAIDPSQYDEQIKKVIEGKTSPNEVRENSLPPIQNLKEVKGNERNTEDSDSNADD